eukprot:jgi/Galph1/1879/GphlegSOOS_G560.1
MVEIDRRLKNIIHTIELNNLKQAWKQVTNLIQKKPDWQALAILKATILDKSGKTTEADAILHPILETKQWQQDTLNIMEFFCKERRDWLTLGNIYEDLWLKQTHLWFGETSFLHYIKAKVYSEAQKVASKLSRSSKQKPYIAWWIVALLLQKYISEHETVSPEFIRLYIQLLSEWKAIDEAKHVLSNYIDQLTQDIVKKDFLLLLGSLYDECGQTDAALTIYQQLVVEYHIENYDYWYHWMQCFFQKATKLESVDNTNEEATNKMIFWNECLDSFLYQSNQLCCSITKQLFVADSHAESRRKRTLLMIQMEACRQVHCKMQSSSTTHKVSERLLQLIHSYLDSFSNYSFCSSDLKTLVTCLEENERHLLTSRLEQPFNAMLSSVDNLNSHTIQMVEYLWLLLYMNGLHIDSSTLLRQYIKLAKPQLKPFDQQPADGLILIVVNQLLMNSNETFTSSLIEAISVLELGKHYSPYAIEFRLFLVLFYAYLGCHELAMEEWHALDLKHIQLLTMSFMIRPFLERWHSCVWMHQCHKKLFQFAKEHMNETPEGIFLALDQQSYETALDMIEFREKVDHSEALLASTVYTFHDSLFHQVIHTHKASLKIGCLSRQWKEETCLKASLVVLDDHSAWKGLGWIKLCNWLGTNEERIQWIRLDYINLRLLTCLMVGELETISILMDDYVVSCWKKQWSDDHSSFIQCMTDYWHIFWQLVMNLHKVCNGISVDKSSFDGWWCLFLEQWQLCQQMMTTMPTTVPMHWMETFPQQYIRLAYVVYHVLFYGLVSIAYLQDECKRICVSSRHHSQISNGMTFEEIQPKLNHCKDIFNPEKWKAQWLDSMTKEMQVSGLMNADHLSLSDISQVITEKYRLLVKEYFQRIQKLQQDCKTLIKIDKSIILSYR